MGIDKRGRFAVVNFLSLRSIVAISCRWKRAPHLSKKLDNYEQFTVILVFL